ncbi:MULTISPECIES: M2 family metallopeptidase [unclassified Sphingopyxis]|uniref:M2 family metallopeptidase n=1 Tax=unclassified Sphingopyxis TaxID=2614943 RepID=UPI0007309EC0|nr:MULTISPECIES: M2 family metallopeptidase [unclassified Sphingopyxis]KTE25877.1 peptidyl-dipeptidase [Sphingopyxis sp. H057]KTE51557.1 peptidyl-dipeptidase [Sphingopyxis sp. H073]KTE53940.1 peptidyl-dipeptidase [Sphingopyxis sp. H071]KTE58943.1 peptidyl-dipeptidase [Sphingopyxis sp. H107]KTE65564.1 peptidyl-dipeptidase [Sphingopyxis sp. H100]
MKAIISTLSLALSLAAATPAFAQAAPAAPTAADADAFVAAVEKDLFDYTVESSQVNWVNATYITEDTDAMASRINAVGTEKSVKYALEAAKYAGVAGLSADTKRKLDILRTGIVLPAPTTPGAATELNTIATDLQSQYGKGRGTLNGKEISGSDIEAEMGNLKNTPAQFAEMWTSWHDQVGAPMKDDYVKMVGIANAGAKELGFADTGAMWRSGYDMPPEEFAKLTEKIWQDMKPLYVALHTYVRWKLNEKYGDAVQPKTGPIRADLLGNMWAQEWGNIYPLVAPPGTGDLGYDIGDLLTEKGKGPLDMVKAGENFYSSLGMAPLPDTFWKRSQFLKPADREVVCHASAWDVDNKDDLRIKMCIKVNADDFITIHHELGHNYYQRAYNKQPFLYLNGANDGFHEAIGDFVALSITPQYLVDIGLLDKSKVPSADKDIGLLLRQAMDKVAFLPFGLLVDRWRWGVFDGSIKPADYNKAWTDLRLQYQGIVPPGERPANAFDAGAKYHIPGNTPYTRYFLARVLQFQFYQAACKQAGWKGPLHRCSFYGNKEVGAKLNAMLEMGASKPWPDALQAFTGSREMSGKAMAAYFAPLKKWLDEQNKGKPSGW